ncbi:MAG: DDE-type integrase/transposase/recombinase [Candidatus Aenigmatarchaeota archaeon]
MTICLWFRKFGNCAREMLRKMGIHFSKICYGDEMWIKAKNKWFYLYIIIDSNNNLIAMHVSPHRDKKSAIAVLRKARQVAGKPDIIVTDEWNGYSGAI